MDLVLSRLEQLEEKSRLQAETIRAQASSLLHLEAEVAVLRGTVRDQKAAIATLSIASLPEGHWVWDRSEEKEKERMEVEEVDRREGVWRWSLEKYGLASARLVDAEAPATLPSLPVELLVMIFDLLDSKTRFGLCFVSLRFLEVASKYIYGETLKLNSTESASFTKARFFDPSPKSARISSLLLPLNLKLSDLPPSLDWFSELIPHLTPTFQPPRQPLPIQILILQLKDISHLMKWSNILRLLNPRDFQLSIGRDDDNDRRRPPTVHYLPLQTVTCFSSNWDRLSAFASSGSKSVLLVQGKESELALVECLLRSGSWTRKGSEPSLSMRVKMEDGTEIWEEVLEKDLAAILGREFSSDPRVRKVSLDVD